ncbi:histidine kinase [Roseivirga pacifica]|uniref:Histidine kinase n=1 Tax=Roseivirga pacifica TaxID=1267423 RepID=A0A1I0MV29_9BACT|nr:histidine kinase [Roseivirga pacifica]RKQ50727.1 histidine kinase [Roseivirga pacifica]SEV92649.1 Histidine kinase [Roseivirga pacifica]
MNKSKLYWLLQFGGWSGLMFTSFLAMIMLTPTWLALSMNLLFVVFGVLISHLYRRYVKKKDWKNLEIKQLVPRVFLASILQGLVHGVISLLLIIVGFALIAQSNPEILEGMTGLPKIEGVDEETQKLLQEASMKSFTPTKIIVFLISFIISFAVYFISWSSIYFAYQYLQRTREVEIEKWKLSASVKDAELSALKAQINPHFIFNSLNNIRSLVIEDYERARDSITHLSDLLRFSIQFDQYERVSLDKELAVVKDYLNLEAIQLEERLKYDFRIDKSTKEFQVPPMIVQTLVENAIKHSINELPNGGEIIIETKLDVDFLYIYVKNTGQLKVNRIPGHRRGIGINNSKERLRLLYGQKSSLVVENMNEKMVCATVKIPLDQHLKA